MKTQILNSNRTILSAIAASVFCLLQTTLAGNLYQFGTGASPNPVVPNVILSGSQIDFQGNANLDTSIGTATSFTSIIGLAGFANATNPVVQNPTGTYSPVPSGLPVPFSNFTFGGLTPSSNFLLWSFNSGGTQYSFTVSTVSIAFQQAFPTGGGLLNLTGTGIATIGSDSSLATWSITSTSQGSQPVTFSAAFTTLSPVPEPSEFALVAVSVVLFGVYRRYSNKPAPVRIK